MTVGNIVVVKEDKRLMGEIVAIDDMDRATVKLCDTEIEVLIECNKLCCTGSTQPHRDSGKVVHILGTEYKIIIIEENDYRHDKEADGWCDPSVKELMVFNFKQDAMSVRDLISYQKKVIRHEIVHAFLYESGLWQSSYGSKCWAQNEEMVDWIAIQSPKLYKAYEEAGVNE